MTHEERAAFIISQSVSAMVTALGMQAENQQRAAVGSSMAYTEDAFQAVLDDHRVRHNDVISFIND